MKITPRAHVRVMGLFAAICCLALVSMADANPITVGETSLINDYPETVTFEISAASSAAPIASVRLNITVRGDTSVSVNQAEFTPGRQVVARYVWKTRKSNIPPGAPLRYTWTVRDEAGNVFETEPADYVITDARFAWQTLEDKAVAVWWYEGDANFGQRVFDVATRALSAMEQSTGEALPHRLYVVLYKDRADFDSWHDYVREWVGGEAYSRIGLTVQIVPPRNTDYWIEHVIPHEVAHLFFYQMTYNPGSAAPPSWVNEGLAQYYEFGLPQAELDWVRQAARRGELIPLRLAGGNFTGSDERIRLLYAESLSAVTFLFERWGSEGMGNLLAAYKAGGDTDTALISATGLNYEEFQQAWWEWLGGEPGAYPEPPASAGIATPRPPAERPTIPPPLVTPARPAQPSDAFAVGPLWLSTFVCASCVCGALALGALLVVIALARRSAR